ncbi:MAG TPA: AmmeMemoRadiSam system radical SAM enzyme, partial [Planctomycetes bacterium]|nr:AmmeMemoRadiSam system radical SAM enzyme [Planctomycetota bacterium]
GRLAAESYGRVTSLALDPVEKKPLYHFFPGRRILSVGTYGCNLQCRFCQNSEISQQSPPDVGYDELPPETLVRLAADKRSIGIAYTYNEPLIWYEYVLDASRLAHAEGLANVLVTNGYVNPEPLAELLPYIDAMNVDIKSFREEFYRDISGGRLAPVLDTVKASVKAGVLVETTTLIIPGHNDSDEELGELAAWIAAEAGEDTPAHLSAYYQRYRFSAPPTPVETLARAYGIFRKRLKHVYIGNVAMEEGAHTRCRECGALLIQRMGYSTRKVDVGEGGSCGRCGADNKIVESIKRGPSTSDK